MHARKNKIYNRKSYGARGGGMSVMRKHSAIKSKCAMRVHCAQCTRGVIKKKVRGIYACTMCVRKTVGGAHYLSQ